MGFVVLDLSRDYNRVAEKEAESGEREWVLERDKLDIGKQLSQEGSALRELRRPREPRTAREASERPSSKADSSRVPG